PTQGPGIKRDRGGGMGSGAGRQSTAGGCSYDRGLGHFAELQPQGPGSLGAAERGRFQGDRNSEGRCSLRQRQYKRALHPRAGLLEIRQRKRGRARVSESTGSAELRSGRSTDVDGATWAGTRLRTPGRQRKRPHLVSGFLRTVERRRPRHSCPQRSQSRIREAAMSGPKLARLEVLLQALND